MKIGRQGKRRETNRILATARVAIVDTVYGNCRSVIGLFPFK